MSRERRTGRTLTAKEMFRVKQTSEGGGRVVSRGIHHRYMSGIQYHGLILLFTVLCIAHTLALRSQGDPARLQDTKVVSNEVSSDPTISECLTPKKGHLKETEELAAKIEDQEGQLEENEDPNAKVKNSKGHLKENQQLTEEPVITSEKTEDFTKTAAQTTENSDLPTQNTEKSKTATTKAAERSENLAKNAGKAGALVEAPQEDGHKEGSGASGWSKSWAKGVKAMGGAVQRARSGLLSSLERRRREVSSSFSSVNFTSLESALLSLAFLTFAVFLVDLVQDLLNGTTSTTTRTVSRRRRDIKLGLLKRLASNDDEEGDQDDRMADLIVLTLSSIDTLSYGRENPDCGRKLLCHLNRSGWHDGLLGTASNYFVSLVFSFVSPSAFQDNLDAATFGREKHDCTSRYSSCPSVIGELLPAL